MNFRYSIYINIAIVFFVIGLIIFGCGTKTDMPTDYGSGQGNLGGAGDTTYIRLTSWSAEQGSDYQFDHPQDIIYGWDESIYVADTGNNRILRYSKTGYFFADEIIDIPSDIGFSNPTAISQDVLMFLYAVNGTNKIFAYLPFSNYQETFRDTFVVFEGPPDARYMGIASDGTSQHDLYLTDSGRDELVKMRLFSHDLQEVYVPVDVEGAYVDSVVKVIWEHGTGVTGMDDPRQITVDSDMRIYFVQTCPDPNAVFYVQSMFWDTELLEYRSELYLQFGTIANNNLFLEPNDIAVRGQGSVKYVYVADTGHDLIRVYKFKNNALEFQKPLLNEDGGALFDQPMGIAVAPFDDEKEYVIYIADTNNNRIERYWLSVPKN
ncbi:MAG: hypothetical protein B6244_02305 [Candidatus Cloacimonetes bacterium 4572_55]|nr:MAG: hypothetical protein B6244_02305 [Candidatus Cloacimonetes bacterium 4572_55]